MHFSEKAGIHTKIIAIAIVFYTGFGNSFVADDLHMALSPFSEPSYTTAFQDEND